MKGSSTPLVRRLVTWVLVSTLVVLAALAITRIWWLREQLVVQSQRQLEQRLEERVRSWEERFLDTLDNQLETVAERVDTAEAMQEKLRSDPASYFEAVYVWIPSRRITEDGRPLEQGARMVFPRPHRVGDRQASSNHPCMQDARQLRYTGVSARVVADAYLAACRDAPPPGRLEAALSATTVLAEEGRIEEALTALENAGVPPELTLDDALDLGIPADRAIVFRNRLAELYMARSLPGDEDTALNLYYETGQQLAELDAPDARGLEQSRWVLLDELRSHDRDRLYQRLQIDFEVLERRLRAYREITAQVLPEAPGRTSSEPRLIRDQHAERPYLLYYNVLQNVDGEWYGVALQLDQQLVLNDFLRSTGELRTDLAITDASGTWLLGARRQPRELAVKVPLTETLSHLRVGLYEDAIERRSDRNDEQWILPLILTTVLVIIAFFALSAEIAAQRRLRDLLARQRAFTTRVTHELKTPIAGIKVMAENIELGAFKGELGRAEAARRIVEEADRLTARIEEVLSSTRERRVPDPEVFDLEEVIFDLIDQWGPRMEQRGVQLEADLDLAPEVKGDPRAVRDAISCLLDNALKYRDDRKDARLVRLSLAETDGDALVVVEDNGLGVPKRMREKIFERFVRVEGPNRGLAGGHGLGLAQVARIAESHGGRVWCEDGIDGGARFLLRLRGER